ncbi:MAG: hypothetical protein H0U32_09790 [Thermoleophilaceae bacterium]|nr:hypothetical protein [Thermoleophilaceae bacterium]
MRGTSRTDEGAAAIGQEGFEGVVADPDRLGTVLAQLEGVSVACWLMGSATGSPERLGALHGPRIQTMLERLVDTPVRGIVYEAQGSVHDHLLDQGAAAVNTAGRTWSMPVEVARADPADTPAWTKAMRAAVTRVLGA